MTRWLPHLALFGSVASLTGCTPPHARSTLKELDSLARLVIEPVGELVYRGRFQPEKAPRPRYEYFRWTTSQGGLQVSTHIARLLSTGKVAVRQRAISAPDGRLQSFCEIQEQTGVRSCVLIEDDGSLSFSRLKDGRPAFRTEPGGSHVLVGPTLYDYVRTHSARLLRGESLRVRFAAADRMRTLRFQLRVTRRTSEQFTVEFAPVDFFTRLVVRPMTIVFDDRFDQVVSYVGLVPARLPAGGAFRAKIDYDPSPGPQPLGHRSP